jgi:hypothetical protein
MTLSRDSKFADAVLRAVHVYMEGTWGCERAYVLFMCGFISVSV